MVIEIDAAEVCMLQLGRPGEARDALTESLALLPTAERHRRLTLLTDLARAHVMAGNLEEACSRTRDIAQMVRELESPVKLQRLAALRQDLAIRREARCVRLLEDELATEDNSKDET